MFNLRAAARGLHRSTLHRELGMFGRATTVLCFEPTSVDIQVMGINAMDSEAHGARARASATFGRRAPRERRVERRAIEMLRGGSVNASPHSAFLAACRGEAHARRPVWFMRQAGRSLPEYRAIRGEGSILDAIRKPELAAEITLQPVRRYGVDAAILYSDIVVPVAAIGFGVDVAPGTGPVTEQPFRSEADLAPSASARARARHPVRARDREDPVR